MAISIVLLPLPMTRSGSSSHASGTMSFSGTPAFRQLRRNVRTSTSREFLTMNRRKISSYSKF